MYAVSCQACVSKIINAFLHDNYTSYRVERTPTPYPKSTALGPREGILAVPGCKNVVDNSVAHGNPDATKPLRVGHEWAPIRRSQSSPV